ncbi:MAG: ATP-binding protein [Pseudomonadota bacterium]
MSRIWPQSLFGRNALLLATTVILSLSLSLLSIYWLILNSQLDRFSSIAAELVNTLSSAAFEVPPETLQALLDQADASPYLRIMPPGVVPEIGEHRENLIQRRFMQRFIDQLEYQSEMDWRVDGDQSLWLRLRIGDEFYWVAAESSTLWTPLRWFILFVFVITAVVVTIVIIATRHISKPLAALKEETDRLSLSSDWDMTPIKGPTEITSLAKSFSRMTARLKEAETVRAETLAELSHDLRTPLARLRLAVEMMEIDDELKDSANRQVHQIDRLIGQFMDYARNGDAEKPTNFDLVSLVEDVAAEFGVPVEGPIELQLTGQRELIGRAIVNLIENAQKYGVTPVRVVVSKTLSHALVSVEDQGEGFSPERAYKMLEPFARGAHKDRVSGSGLGLAIVNRVATAHRGRIVFEKLEPTGFRAKLFLALDGEAQSR